MYFHWPALAYNTAGYYEEEKNEVFNLVNTLELHFMELRVAWSPVPPFNLS